MIQLHKARLQAAQVTEAADSVAMSFQTLWSNAMAGEVGFKTAISIAVVIVVLIVRKLLLNFVEKRLDDPRTRYSWSKGLSYSTFFVAALVIFVVWTGGNVSLGAFLGLLTAGVAIALRDLVADLAGWIFILTQRPLEVGDRVEVGGHAGDVVDIGVFHFTILEIGNWVDADQSTGRVIHIPNQKVFTDSVANYTSQFEFLWNEIEILVTFESDWRKAKSILLEVLEEEGKGLAEKARQAVKRATRKYLISYKKLTPVVYTSVHDSGIALTGRYICMPRSRRGSSEAIWESLLERLEVEPTIDFAYPTQRIYYNPIEGKEGARAEHPHGGGPTGVESS